MTRKDQELLFEKYKRIVLKENHEMEDDVEIGFHGDELEDVDVDAKTLDDHLLKLLGSEVRGLLSVDSYLETANSIADSLTDHYQDQNCVHLVNDILSYSGLTGNKVDDAKKILAQICSNPAKFYFSSKKKLAEKDARRQSYSSGNEEYEHEDGIPDDVRKDYGI
jgi:hypothetical protein